MRTIADLRRAADARKNLPEQANIVEMLTGPQQVRAHEADLDPIDMRLYGKKARRDRLGGKSANIGEDGHPALARAAKALDAICEPPAGNSHGVSKRARFRITDQARKGIPEAGLGHDRADRQEAEAETGQCTDKLAVLVEPGSKPDRAGQVYAGKPGPQPGIVDLQSLECGKTSPRQAEAQGEVPDGMALIGR